jgi:hypothetical protein
VRIVTLPGFVAWDRLGIAVEHFVEYNGKPVLSVKKAFRKVAKLCEPDLSEGNVTPHTMRDTAAAWLMQAGVDLWVAAGYLGMTVETLERTYGYHPPDLHLPEMVRQIVILTVGARFGAAYEIYAHGAVALANGMSAERLATIAAGLRPADLTSEEGIG